MKKMTRVLSGAFAATVLLGACGGTYDRAEYITEFTEAGIDEETANCIVDGLEERVGPDKLGGRASGLDDEDTAAMEEITLACVLGG